MPIIDTHVHYNLSPLKDEWQHHWQRAQAHGVVGALLIGVDLPSSRLAIDQANQVGQWRCAVGVHPESAQPINDSIATAKNKLATELDQMQTLASSTQVIAIGECGLDYFRLPVNQTQASAIIQLQKWLLQQHLNLASQLNLPLIIHLRDKAEQAYWDFLETYHQSACTQPFVLHCVSGPPSFLKKALDFGAYVGVDGNVTYPRADELSTLVKMTPPRRILLETDAPYLPPMPHRGQTCLPEMIELTARYLKQTFDLDTQQIFENTQLFFPAFRPIKHNS